jgi:hypothetical protein
MKTKQQRKDEAWKKYLKIEKPALREYLRIEQPAYREYEGIRLQAYEEYENKCAEIDNEEGETEETEIIHNGKKYRLVEE